MEQNKKTMEAIFYNPGGLLRCWVQFLFTNQLLPELIEKSLQISKRPIT
jgi:hypothetical protein